MIKKIVITGGAGFIGHHAVKTALDKGYEVHVIDNLSTGKIENLKGLDVKFWNCDITSNNLPSIDGGFDMLIHLAAPVSVEESLSNPIKYKKGCVEGSRNIFKWALQNNRKNVVAASTAAVYGDVEKWPFVEDQNLNPMSPYASGKLEMESVMKSFNSSNFKCTALRFFNVFGEGQPSDVGYVSAIPIFLKQNQEGKDITVTGDGQQTRDFVYVKDVVNACFKSLERNIYDSKMLILNIAHGQEFKILDIAKAISNNYKHIAPRKEPKRSLASIDLAKEFLDWRPTINVLDWLKSKQFRN